MVEGLSAPPALSTPDSHILNDTSDVRINNERLSDEQVETRYEIRRTIAEIKRHRWRRVALQFPDEMLQHSPRVYRLLARGLRQPGRLSSNNSDKTFPDDQEVTEHTEAIAKLSLDEDEDVKLTILGDTSYGSCCVDEIAAEHVDADALIHYGRACLSPTARLPALHIFTKRNLDHDQVLRSFRDTFPDTDTNVILTADVPYASHVQELAEMFEEQGYNSVFAAAIQHDPASSTPNRTVPPSIASDPSILSDWHIFHISDPPTSLLLTLAASVASIHVYHTEESTNSTDTAASLQRSTAVLLRRRYALVTSLATVPVWGILINTLSVKNYLSMVGRVKQQISDAGKKSYLFVVGKINAAKVANFSEIGGWVVIGCWESSLIDSKEFYKPIITPYELQLALQPDSGRVWTGKWRADFDSVLNSSPDKVLEDTLNDSSRDIDPGSGSEEESEPPEFDLRTGRYITRTRPMGQAKIARPVTSGRSEASNALAKRINGDVVSVNGIASPAAEYLAQNRTWRGLEISYDESEQEGGILEEGRTGVASGYTVGESEKT